MASLVTVAPPGGTTRNVGGRIVGCEYDLACSNGHYLAWNQGWVELWKFLPRFRDSGVF